MMLRKKQVITVVSIAAISFLIGTLFNMNFIVSGGKGKDKDEDLWKAISELQSKVETLENQSLPQGYVGLPAYDSGWILVPWGGDGFILLRGTYIIVTHGLGTTNVIVDVQYKNNQGPVEGIQHVSGELDETNGWFNLNSSHIWIFTGKVSSGFQNYIRVRIWKIQ